MDQVLPRGSAQWAASRELARAGRRGQGGREADALKVGRAFLQRTLKLKPNGTLRRVQSPAVAHRGSWESRVPRAEAPVRPCGRVAVRASQGRNAPACAVFICHLASLAREPAAQLLPLPGTGRRGHNRKDGDRPPRS